MGYPTKNPQTSPQKMWKNLLTIPNIMSAWGEGE